MSSLARTIYARLLLPLLALTLVGCDNPVEEEEHPIGLVLLNAQNQEVASFRVGTGATGQVRIAPNTPTTFTVAAIGESGAQLAIDGSELGLKVAFSGGAGSATLQAPNRVVVTSPSIGGRSLVLTLTHEGHDELEATFVVGVS